MLYWRFPTIGLVAAFLLLFLLYLLAGDPALWLLFLVIPCIAVLVLFLLVLLIFRRTRRLSAGLLLSATVFVAATAVGWHFEDALRPKLRWAFGAAQFKKQVLAQRSDSSGDFKHVEWDGWGGAPVGDWTAYVVYDPSNSLSRDVGSQHSRTIKGIPCDVLRLQRLEPRWYSATLEMNEEWDNCRKE